MVRCGSLAALAAAVAAPAAAQDRPLLMPERDVAVVYRVVGGPPGVPEMRMAWLAGEGRRAAPGSHAAERASGLVNHRSANGSSLNAATST